MTNESTPEVTLSFEVASLRDSDSADDLNAKGLPRRNSNMYWRLLSRVAHLNDSDRAQTLMVGLIGTYGWRVVTDYLLWWAVEIDAEAGPMFRNERGEIDVIGSMVGHKPSDSEIFMSALKVSESEEKAGRLEGLARPAEAFGEIMQTITEAEDLAQEWIPAFGEAVAVVGKDQVAALRMLTDLCRGKPLEWLVDTGFMVYHLGLMSTRPYDFVEMFKSKRSPWVEHEDFKKHIDRLTGR